MTHCSFCSSIHCTTSKNLCLDFSAKVDALTGPGLVTLEALPERLIKIAVWFYLALLHR